MKHNINLATKVYINFKQVNLVLMLFFLLCSCWMAFNLYILTSDIKQKNKYTELSAKKGRGSEVKPIPNAEYKKFLDKVKYVNDILYKRSYDWLSLLENLEKLVPAGVSLSSLQPSSKGDTLKFTGMATGFPSIRKLMENLEGSKVFTEIYLTDQSITKIDKRQAINFTITCKASTP